MGKRLDLVGQKFGRLTCVSFIKMDINHQSVFEFKCICGNTIERIAQYVKSGDTKSCGCSKRSNLIGQKFNKLTCLEFIKVDKKRRSVFKFQCDCGYTITTSGSSVKEGNTKSCGCLHKESASELGSLVGLNNGRSTNKGWTYGTTRMRSGYEIFYAHYLDENRIDWEYEPETFKLGNGIRYTPDFYLTESDTWVEIKGKMTDENRRKISLFRKLTGNKLKVYFIKDLEKMMGQSYYTFMKENKQYYL